jgi:type VI secretion system protein ImpG
MDPRLLEYYNRELQFIREMGADFAREYPRIAARLGMDGIECSDPYVERLLEGYALLAARIQLKLDARHPDFTAHLLEMVYPGFLAPVPSCAVVQFHPNASESGLLEGVRVARNSSLRTQPSAAERTACEFRTAQDVVLWPVAVSEAQYVAGTNLPALRGVARPGRVRAALRLRIKTVVDVPLRSLPIDELTFYIKATPDVSQRVYEQVAANATGTALRAATARSVADAAGPESVGPIGFEDAEALLPAPDSGFRGYRLLQEYFTFPERFLFFRVSRLRERLAAVAGDSADLYVLFDRVQPALEHALDPDNFRLFCTPAVNLFPRVLDRVHVTPFETEHHIVPDRNRPLDFEVHTLLEVTATGDEDASRIPVAPFYSETYRTALDQRRAYYTLQRRRRLYSDRQEQRGARSTYIGTECFLSLTDGREETRPGWIRQLDAKALCTNRDLPIQLALGRGATDFLLDGAAPVEGIRAVAGPSPPRVSPAFGETAWKLISHLSLNYLSLAGSETHRSVDLLREMLALYADRNDPVIARQIDGIQQVQFRPAVHRLPVAGPISFGRGLEIDLTMDESAFEGMGVALLGSVLDRFFARYVSINSFTRTRALSTNRGEVMRWPVRIGTRPAI